MKNLLLVATVIISAAVIAADASTQPTQEAKSAQEACKEACKKPCKEKKQAKAKKGAKPKRIAKQAAIDAALAHAGLKREEIRDLKCKLEKEDGVLVYEVEFESGNFDYEYDIEALTGKILESKKEID